MGDEEDAAKWRRELRNVDNIIIKKKKNYYLV